MAGEWLKMECATPDKPEVFAITSKMAWDDPDLTVGKLFRVWRWFDQQTIDGNAAGVTSALLDRIAGATGFAQAMIDVHWLTVTESGVELPNFEKHNGATAKSRAQTAKRVANHRSDAPSNANCNATTVTPALAREEKKREEKKVKTKPQRDPAGFASFWLAYPKKVKKPEAQKAFDKIDVTLLDTILKSIEAFKRTDQWLADSGKYIPHPASWLNGKRWEDELTPSVLSKPILPFVTMPDLPKGQKPEGMPALKSFVKTRETA